LKLALPVLLTISDPQGRILTLADPSTVSKKGVMTNIGGGGVGHPVLTAETKSISRQLWSYLRKASTAFFW